MILPISPDLLSRARAGDAEAFEYLLRSHERQVLRLAVRLTGTLEDGQDVAQEVFLKLHSELGRLRSNDEIAPWLYRVTVNACFDARRKRQRSRLQSVGSEWSTWRCALPTPEERAVSDETARLHESGMRNLSDRERAVIALRDLEGLTTAEVAAVFGSAESTVRVQVANARVKLRKFFEGMRGKTR